MWPELALLCWDLCIPGSTSKNAAQDIDQLEVVETCSFVQDPSHNSELAELASSSHVGPQFVHSNNPVGQITS